MCELDILSGISKVPFEIPHKISYPYIERYGFHTTSKFQEFLDLRAHVHFLNANIGMHAVWGQIESRYTHERIFFIHPSAATS